MKAAVLHTYMYCFTSYEHVTAYAWREMDKLYSWHHKSAYTRLHLCGLEHSCACPTDIWTSVTMSLGTAHQHMQP